MVSIFLRHANQLFLLIFSNANHFLVHIDRLFYFLGWGAVAPAMVFYCYYDANFCQIAGHVG
jgi:hypothetical protein